MSEPVKAYKSPVLSSHAVCSHPGWKVPVSPVGDLRKLFDALAAQTTALETVPFPGPSKPFHTSRLK
jgi:hypothetical protein